MSPPCSPLSGCRAGLGTLSRRGRRGRTQAVWFILRGIGLSDAAIARHSDPQALAAAWPGMAPEPRPASRPGRARCRSARRNAEMVLRFIIMALLLAIVLGGLYGFNAFRSRRSPTIFANNKPPPTQISAAEAAARGCAAVPAGDRLAGRGPSGHGHPRGRRAGHRDLLRARHRRSRPATSLVQLNDGRSRAICQLPGAGALGPAHPRPLQGPGRPRSSRRRRPSTTTRASSTRPAPRSPRPRR